MVDDVGVPWGTPSDTAGASLNRLLPRYEHRDPMTLSYRYLRSDFVAMSLALSRPSLAKRLLVVGGYYAFLVAIAYALIWWHGPKGLTPLNLVPELPLWAWIFVIVASALLLAPHWLLTSPMAAMIFSSNAVANQQLEFTLNERGISTRVIDLEITSQIGWAAVQRLIETRHGLFLTISRREALVLPRRSFDGTGNYDAIKGFIASQTGKAWS